jgi:hypothetical protein
MITPSISATIWELLQKGCQVRFAKDSRDNFLIQGRLEIPAQYEGAEVVEAQNVFTSDSVIPQSEVGNDAALLYELRKLLVETEQTIGNHR